MRRLVIAATTLLALVGALVVVAYLFIFGAATDRTSAMAPARSLAYASVYLTPSTGQQMRLADLLSKLPGFSDRTALGDKIDAYDFCEHGKVSPTGVSRCNRRPA